jgi:hypothetical protein
MVAASVARCGVLPLMLVYVHNPDVLDGLGMQGADITVCAINMLFCISHGLLFSRTFSQAQARFKTAAGASRASSTLNVMYYVGITFAIGSTLAINTLMCVGDPRSKCARPGSGHNHHRNSSGVASTQI